MELESNVKSPATNTGCPEQSKATSLNTPCIVRSSKTNFPRPSAEARSRSREKKCRQERTKRGKGTLVGPWKEDETRDQVSVCPDIPTQQQDNCYKKKVQVNVLSTGRSASIALGAWVFLPRARHLSSTADTAPSAPHSCGTDHHSCVLAGVHVACICSLSCFCSFFFP